MEMEQENLVNIDNEEKSVPEALNSGNNLSKSDIEKLIEEKVKNIEITLNQTLEKVDQKNSGLASSIKKQMQKEEIKKNEDNLSLKSLQKELENMRGELANKEKSIKESSRNSEIQQFFNSKGVQGKSSLSATKLFLSDYSNNLVEYEGEWYFQKGDDVSPLNEKLDHFLTEESDLFLPKEKYKGIGMKPQSSTPPSKKGLTLNEALFLEE